MVTKCTRVMLSSGEDTEENDDGKRKANKIKN